MDLILGPDPDPRGPSAGHGILLRDYIALPRFDEGSESSEHIMHLAIGDTALWRVLFSLALWSHVVLSAVVDQGQLAAVNGIHYYVGRTAVSSIVSSESLNWTNSDPDVLPLTVIRSNASRFTSDTLTKTVDNFTASDDVFQPGFLDSG